MSLERDIELFELWNATLDLSLEIRDAKPPTAHCRYPEYETAMRNIFAQLYIEDIDEGFAWALTLTHDPDWIGIWPLGLKEEAELRFQLPPNDFRCYIDRTDDVMTRQAIAQVAIQCGREAAMLYKLTDGNMDARVAQ